MIKSKYILPLIFLFGCKNNQSESNFYPADDHVFIYSDNTVRSDGHVYFSWSNSGVEFNSDGKNLEIILADHSSGQSSSGKLMHGHYAVIIDGVVNQYFESAENKTSYKIELPEGDKHIEIRRINEPRVSTTEFIGIKTSGKINKSDVPEKVKIEVIGNSITSGYGNIPENTPCGFSPETQDFTKSYAFLVSKKLGASLNVYAWSGRGLVTNYDKSTSGNMTELYPHAVPHSGFKKKVGTEYQPDIVFIHLGTNDFAHSIPDKENWIKAYLSFIKRVNSRYPGTNILLLGGPTIKDRENFPAFSKLSEYLDEINEQAKIKNWKTSVLIIENFDDAGSGCDAHPDYKAHKRMAATIINKVNKILK
ncbi:SGNH/GDSL hydrolase family protein [Mangrovivirga cuniculi]|uniref:Endoglucanase E n=1 Tax=Mangrovivirga cuniculi TaxID=2715131 RepID=A0A4D7JTB3_9BACT|nr:SGNH/GDSL hydrolase family protein [Mangrovivirga cuniculi]QCK16760.1 hypothetical protein DCC35_19495 [Mangrovivirga cuniculi]